MQFRNVVGATIAACVGAIVITAYGMGIVDVADLFPALWLLGSLAAGGIVALFLQIKPRGHRGAAPSRREPGAEAPHAGINMAHIPIAGFPGLVFALGFLWMFWFGVPPYRPIVVGVVLLGCVAAVVLIALERRHQTPSETLLHLRNGPDRDDHPVRPE